MDLSFVALTWNSERYLERFLSSIDSALDGTGISYEILVLDNGSRDATARMLSVFAEGSGGRLRPIFEQTNTGTTRSRNRLFGLATGEYLCVIDSDVELEGGVIETLLARLAEDKDLGIVVPRINYPSGAWQKSYDRFPTCIDKVNRFFRLRQIESDEGLRVGDRREPFVIDYAISAFWLLRSSLLERVGKLDEHIFYAPEDVDFCLRVWKSGFRILYDPSVSVIHHTQEISRGMKINMAKLSHIKGLAYYFLKHRYWLRRPEFPRRYNASTLDLGGCP